MYVLSHGEQQQKAWRSEESKAKKYKLQLCFLWWCLSQGSPQASSGPWAWLRWPGSGAVGVLFSAAGNLSMCILSWSGQCDPFVFYDSVTTNLISTLHTCVTEQLWWMRAWHGSTRSFMSGSHRRNWSYWVGLWSHPRLGRIKAVSDQFLLIVRWH